MEGMKKKKKKKTCKTREEEKERRIFFSIFFFSLRLDFSSRRVGAFGKRKRKRKSSLDSSLSLFSSFQAKTTREISTMASSSTLFSASSTSKWTAVPTAASRMSTSTTKPIVGQRRHRHSIVAAPSATKATEDWTKPSDKYSGFKYDFANSVSF